MLTRWTNDMIDLELTIRNREYFNTFKAGDRVTVTRPVSAHDDTTARYMKYTGDRKGYVMRTGYVADRSKHVLAICYDKARLTSESYIESFMPHEVATYVKKVKNC